MKLDSSVCVVGAGPCGLTAALVLARRGVPVHVLERNTVLSTASRASTFHPSTLDLLDELGIGQAFLDFGRVVEAIHWRAGDGQLLAAMSYSLLAGQTRHPYRLHAEQYHLTRLLLEQLHALDHVVVEFGTEVQHAELSPRGVSLLVQRGATHEQLTARYVLAADGSRSTVRRSLGIPFPETNYPTYALRVITRTDITTLLPGTSALTYVRDPAGSASLLGLPDHWRLIFRIDAALDPHQAVQPSTVDDLIRAACPFRPEQLAIAGAQTYRLGRGIAETYRLGRVLLIGDAAHITSTAGGLNMNCGLHDAVDIASTAATVLLGDGGGADLDAVAARRRAVVTDQVIPRSEARVAGVATRDDDSLRHAMSAIGQTAADAGRARDYLISASMLDSVPLLAPATPIG